MFDDDPEAFPVSAAAHHALGTIVDLAAPAIVDALPAATGRAAVQLLQLLHALAPAARLGLPAAAHDAIAARTAAPDLISAQPSAVFERELARRHRDGELADWEGVWQVWLRDHPTLRAAALPLLVATGEPSSVAQQLIELLDADIGNHVAWALRDLVPGLDDRLVRAVVASPWPARYPIPLPALARRGELAAPLLELCVACCDPRSAIRMANSAKLALGIEALKAFGRLADRVRPALLELFLAVDEPGIMEPSPRYALVQLLGQQRLVAELRERIDQLPEPDWYATMRKRDFRAALGLTAES